MTTVVADSGNISPEKPFLKKKFYQYPGS